MIKFIGRTALYSALALLVISFLVNVLEPVREENWGHRAQLGEVLEVFDRIQIAIGAETVNTNIYISDSLEVNAFIFHAPKGGYWIQMNRGMLNLFESADELAVILGHEFSHRLLGHLDGDGDDVFPSFYREKYADFMGVSLARVAGYNACVAAGLWSRIANATGGGKFATSTHPASLQRVGYLACDPFSLVSQKLYIKALTRPYYVAIVNYLREFKDKLIIQGEER